jgi:hypothetical protein
VQLEDTMERAIELLDAIYGDADLEANADFEPSAYGHDD